MIRGFELLTRGFELVSRGFELALLSFQLVLLSFQLATHNSCFPISPLLYLRVSKIIALYMKLKYFKQKDIQSILMLKLLTL